jgi:hypothetical protein
MGAIKKVVNTGVGLAALAAAAGAFFIYGKDAAKNRRAMKGWALKLKGEVLEKVENLTSANRGAYHKVVDQVTKRYRRMKNVNKKELDSLVSDLKRGWSQIHAEAGAGSVPARSAAKSKNRRARGA